MDLEEGLKRFVFLPVLPHGMRLLSVLATCLSSSLVPCSW